MYNNRANRSADFYCDKPELPCLQVALDDTIYMITQYILKKSKRFMYTDSFALIIIIIAMHLSAHLKLSLRFQREAKTLNHLIYNLR